ncbi:MAG TPA: zinc ribbon domain-containing protein [Ktedonobacterales bacterium]|nr:zinc ribbon domain-containing protein [Ktedonobacterales bacterium]
MPTLHCPKCHRLVNEGARFCSACGTALTRPAAKAPQEQKAEERPPGNWRQFKNAWYGFTLDKPVDWFARTQSGVTSIAPDAEGYVAVIIRPLQVRKGTSAETLARYLAGTLGKALGSFSAWSDPPAKGAAADPTLLVMRYQGTSKQVPLAGVLVLRVSGELPW